VSRPTLYRHFGSKEGLLEAFGLYEQDNFDAGIATAMAGLSGTDRLDAALRFIVEFQSTYSLGSLADTEPEHVLHQMKRVLPIMHERIARIIPGEGGDVAAAAVVRIAVCHYMIGGGTPDQFLAELRHAAGVGAPRRRLSSAAG
jgi:AcrR family transcriptional regulator